MKTFVRMFKPEFATKVLSGEKCQTVRPTPKRMPEYGDKISLRAWSEKPYRSKQQVLRDAIITRVESVEIRSSEMWIGGRWIPGTQMFDFIKADGFNTAQDMIEWFDFHGGLPFRGIVIYWKL